MKKLLLSVLLISGSLASAQVLQSESFDGLTLGDVGTDITGMTPGQDGWMTAASNGADPTTSTNAANDNFVIVDNGYEAQGLAIVGPDGNKGSRFMWKDGFADLWTGRDAGNEVIDVEYDFYTGDVTASTAQVGIRMYGTDSSVTPAATRTLNGFVYNLNTNVLQGVAYLYNSGATPPVYGTYLVTLATGGLLLSNNTWYRLGLSYNTATGETIWKVTDFTDILVYTGLPEANWAGPYAPDEVDFIMAAPASNAASGTVIFDNYVAKASLEESLLSVGQVTEAANFSVYPNPATSTVNVTTPADASISQIIMTDINGRTVKTVKVDGVSSAQVSVSDLASGVYTMKVVSDMGTAVKKVIKQ